MSSEGRSAIGKQRGTETERDRKDEGMVKDEGTEIEQRESYSTSMTG